MPEFSNMAKLFHHHFPGCVTMDPTDMERGKKTLDDEIEGFSNRGKGTYDSSSYRIMNRTGLNRINKWEKIPFHAQINGLESAKMVLAAIHSAQKIFRVRIRPRIKIKVDRMDFHRSMVVEVSETDIHSRPFWKFWGEYRRLDKDDDLAIKVLHHICQMQMPGI